MTIITISRQAGSLGDEIGKETARILGYDYIEKVQISEILSGLGFSLSDIDRFDEKKPSVWQSLSTQKELFAHYIRAAVYELAARRNVVIIGRGGQAILKDIPGALHVRIIAPYKTRVNRLTEQRSYKERDAQRIIRQRDSDSSGYLSTYFDADSNDSNLYDLVISTRVLTLKKCVELIACAVQQDEIQMNPPSSTLLLDLAIKHKAEAAILKVTGGGELVNLEIDAGVASLSGLVESTAEKNNCGKVLMEIQGIKSVRNELGVRSKDGRIF
ncbi:MAG: hypothetical protein HKP44_04500 [Desulfofustis sp.]|nr:hypothetical protein [Desulfofustis sp.]